LADFRPYRKYTVCIGKYAQDQHFLLADTYESLEGTTRADPGVEGNFINPLGYCNEPEPVFKIYVEMRERVDSMSRLFLTVFINRVLEDWGRYTSTFLPDDSLFWGGGGGGVLSAFSKEILRFTVFFVMPPAYK
jgi:hypothetical protein